MNDNDNEKKYEAIEEQGISKTMAIVTFLALFIPIAGVVGAVIWGITKLF